MQPVKIKGSQEDWFREKDWSEEAIRGVIGQDSVYEQSHKCRPGSLLRETAKCHTIKEKDQALVGKEWAALSNVNLTRLGAARYDELFNKQIELASQGRYVYAHEISGGQLMKLAKRMKQPRYFLNNVQDLSSEFNTTAEQQLRKTHFPSFFFGAAGSSSPLHSDSMMTRFWIMQLAGKKLVRLFPPSQNWRADASDGAEFQPTLYTIDLMRPDYAAHPNMKNLMVYETILYPGDILFIPEGWAHQVLNLEWTAMVSSNYLDTNNLPNIMSLVAYEEEEGTKMELLDSFSWFVPLFNITTDHANTPMLDYFQANILETAEVSDAAKSYISTLRAFGVPSDEWRDNHSRPVLMVAIVKNYMKLAQWLVDEGVSVEDDEAYRHLLLYVESDLKLHNMALWLRNQMGIDADEDLWEPSPKEGEPVPTPLEDPSSESPFPTPDNSDASN